MMKWWKILPDYAVSWGLKTVIKKLNNFELSSGASHRSNNLVSQYFTGMYVK